MNKLYRIVLSCVLGVALFLSACESPKASNDGASESPEKEQISETTEREEAPKPDPVSKHDGEQVKQSVQHLFEIVEGGDFSPAAQFIAYRGPDKEREWKDGYNYEDETEKKEVDKVCAQLAAMQMDLDHYEFIEFFKEKESEGEWNVWEMKFHYKDGAVEDITMAFLRHHSHYLLGDID